MKKTDSFNHFTFEMFKTIDSPCTIRNELENGYAEITIYPFLPGIIVTLNDVHAPEMPSGSYLHDKDIMLINYCIEGRCEFRISDNEYRYVKDKFTSIGSLIVSDRFYYPYANYRGFEIYIYKKLFTEETFRILDLFHINIDDLYRKYNNRENLSILKTDMQCQRVWAELYAEKNPDRGLLLLSVLKILHFFSNTDSITPANALYLTKWQAGLAKEVREILTRDISRHISMREISRQLNVSETSLRNYFFAMFGMSVSEYMQEERLKKSSALLRATQMPISEIAASCGFSNQGRFAGIFKERYGSTPLEYRKMLMGADPINNPPFAKH